MRQALALLQHHMLLHTCVAQSTASACISSDMSAFLMTALRISIPLDIVLLFFRVQAGAEALSNRWRKHKV
jgi:hypothetical protein